MTNNAIIATRLGDFKPRHIENLLLKLCELHNVNDIEVSNLADVNIYNIRNYFSDSQIDEGHRILRQEYHANGANGGEHFYKNRGRPYGAKNKPRYNDKFHNNELINSINKPEDNTYDTATSPSPEITQQFVSMKDFDIICSQLYNVNTQINTINNLIVELSKAICTIQISKPTIVELARSELPNINLGVQHRQFPKLLAMCSAQLRNKSHLNIWIHGPAGTGKSTAVENISKALDLSYYVNGKISYAHELLGHMHGDTYITSQFRQAFEKGGVYCADELDGWLPDALIALNGALANGHAAFPDKIVKRHPNFIFIGAANTTGYGGTIEYVARFKQDAAFNDRCIYLDWPLDEALEDSLCANKDWISYVRKVRANVASHKITGILITPRASIFGEALIAAGLSFEEAAEAVLKKGMTNAQWDMVK